MIRMYSLEVGAWLKEEGPKYQGQCHTYWVGEEENRVFAQLQGEKVRLKNGVKRDGLLQLDMFNFTKHFEKSGGGTVRRRLIWVQKESVRSETKRHGPGQLQTIWNSNLK